MRNEVPITTYSTVHSMKPTPFDGNDSCMRYEYHRTREGPNWFMCYYKNSATGTTDPKDAWRTLGTAKFTDTGKALKEWCLEMHEKYGTVNDDDVGRVDTSFAAEAMKEEEDPTKNTKMVV